MINTLFDRLDDWKQFPSYQLERRSDIFFAMYLHQVLERVLPIPVCDIIVPEFPVRRGSTRKAKSPNKSYKIDYLAVSKDISSVWFIELKTDANSRRKGQDEYLNKAVTARMPGLFDGLKLIYGKTRSRDKYRRLFTELERMGLLRYDEMSTDIISDFQDPEPHIVYIQPRRITKKPGDQVIELNQFADIVAENDDPVSQRFAQSLHRWDT